MRKVAILSLILVLCLAVVGMGYAKWSKTLVINGNIETGSVDVIFCNAECDDPYDESGQHQNIDPGWDKDVAWCQVVPDGDQLFVTLFNGYPCYTANILYDINNVGTIPVKIETIKLVQLSYGEEVITQDMDLVVDMKYGIAIDEATGDVTIYTDPTDEELLMCDFDIQVTGIGDNPQLDPVGYPDIEPYSSDTITGDLHVHVDQAAQQLYHYDFVIEIVASQWNEVP